DLRIAPAQEAAWTAFANEVRGESRAAERAQVPLLRRDRRAARAPAGDLITRLDETDRALSAHIDALGRFRASASTLYGALDENQRRVFDNLIAPRGGRRGRV